MISRKLARLAAAWFFVALMLVQRQAYADFFNAGFENGTFPPAFTAFAGGQSKSLLDATPDGWTQSLHTSGNVDRWVQSTAAHGGNKYIYLSGTTDFPNNECIEQDTDCWGPGKTFTYSAFVASADTGAGINWFNFEFTETDGIGNEVTTTLPFALPANPAWSDAALTVIPWAQVSGQVTFLPTTVSVEFYISTRSTDGTISSIVVDDLDCDLLPEPGSITAIAALGMLVMRRRRA